MKLKEGPIKPLHVNTPRKTPYAYQGAAKGKFDHLVRLGILEKVEDVSEWCSPMSFVPKPDGDMRPVVDLVHLNKFVERPVHPFPTLKDILAQIPGTSKYFAVFKWGCYRYLRAPMGLTSSGDEFCARTDKALAGISGVFKLVYDILMLGDSVEQLLDQVKAIFKYCEEHRITLSETKYQVGTEVKFAGYLVSDKGTKPDPEKVAAISQFPTP